MERAINKLKVKSGFSLLELLAVLVIIAALAGVAIAMFGSKNITAKQIAHNETVRILENQGGAYLMSLTTMPADGEELIDDLVTKWVHKRIADQSING